MFDMGKNRGPCKNVRDSLETSVSAEALVPSLREHLAGCVDCRTAADELCESRALLRKMPARQGEPGPWFAGRVMAAIAARELKVQRSLEAWTVVPKFAARLSCISALAILLAGTWFYRSPRPASRPGGESNFETLFDMTPNSASQDDVLINFERGQ